MTLPQYGVFGNLLGASRRCGLGWCVIAEALTDIAIGIVLYWETDEHRHKILMGLC